MLYFRALRADLRQNATRSHCFESRFPLHVGMDCVPSKIPSRMAGDFSYRSVIPPLRKKSRSARLLGCKRPRDGSLSLPTFCGFVPCGAGDSFCLTLTTRRVSCASACDALFYPLCQGTRILPVQNADRRTNKGKGTVAQCINIRRD